MATKDTGAAGTPANQESAPTATGQAATDAPARKPMPAPAGGWPPDEFTGKYGRYVRDPFTGIRSVAPDA